MFVLGVLMTIAAFVTEFTVIFRKIAGFFVTTLGSEFFGHIAVRTLHFVFPCMFRFDGSIIEKLVLHVKHYFRFF
jgi:uncharacterized membrane protein